MELDEVVEHFTSEPGELLRGMAEATRAGLRPDAEVPELDGPGSRGSAARYRTRRSSTWPDK